MRLCPNCGEENPERFRLCGYCGAKLIQDEAPQAARKLVTVVFCDLAGSTSLGETLDSDRIEATYEAGVLTLVIPVAEQAKPRKVSISRSARDRQAIDA